MIIEIIMHSTMWDPPVMFVGNQWIMVNNADSWYMVTNGI